MIALCGINCGICHAYLREKNRCNGCRVESDDNKAYLKKCIIRNCEQLSKTDPNSCCECETLPCKRLKQLDKRYRTRYNYSPIDILKKIKEIGTEKVEAREKKRWMCRNCGATLCVHRDFCLNCKEKKELGGQEKDL